MEPWQTIIIAIINILAILASPIIALLISNKIQENKDKRKDKVEILKALMKKRGPLQDTHYVDALNLIDLVFVDSEEVRTAYRNLYSEYCKKPEDINLNNINLCETKLIETIVENIGYKDKITWDNIQQPYNPNWLSKQFNAQESYYDLINSANAMFQTKQKEEAQPYTTTKTKRIRNNEQK